MLKSQLLSKYILINMCAFEFPPLGTDRNIYWKDDDSSLKWLWFSFRSLRHTWNLLPSLASHYTPNIPSTHQGCRSHCSPNTWYCPMSTSLSLTLPIKILWVLHARNHTFGHLITVCHMHCLPVAPYIQTLPPQGDRKVWEQAPGASVASLASMLWRSMLPRWTGSQGRGLMVTSSQLTARNWGALNKTTLQELNSVINHMSLETHLSPVQHSDEILALADTLIAAREKPLHREPS